VVQETLDDILIRIIPASDFEPSVLTGIEAGLRPYLGPEVALRFETTDHIALSPTGKFEHIKSLLSERQKPGA
jgi:hypothetical protein